MNQRRLLLKDLAGVGLMIKAVVGLLVGSGFVLAPTGLRAKTLSPAATLKDMFSPFSMPMAMVVTKRLRRSFVWMAGLPAVAFVAEGKG